MESEAKKSKGSTKIEIGVGLLCFVILSLMMICSGMVFPIQIMIYLSLGWFSFLKRILPQVTASTAGLVTSLVLVVLLAGIIQMLGRAAMRYFNRQSSASTVPRWQFRWTLIMVVFLILSFVGGFAVVGIARQTSWIVTTEQAQIRWSGSEISHRIESRNNLKQIGLALHNYHDLHDRLPPGGIFNQTGQPQHSWMTQILPYVDQAPLYNKVDFHQPWNAADNRDIFTTELDVYQIPGPRLNRKEPELPQGYQPAGYAANARVLNVNSGLNFKEIKDGLSNTLLAGEVNSQLKAWGDPTNFRDPALGINAHPRGFGGPFKGGANCLLGDGSARFINENIDPAVLKALATPNGGEDMSRFQEDW